MLILGAHMSIDKGFAAAAEKTGSDYHCNAMQIFTKNPRGRSYKEISDADLQNYKEIISRYGIKYVIAHSSYLLNFGKPLSEIPWAEENLLLDYERLHKLGGHGIVVHIGKAMDGDKASAIRNVIENAKRIIEKSNHTSIDYILENTAGQGTEIGHQFEDLASVWKGLKGFSPRVKFCLDTAHMWGAGYDLSSQDSVTKIISKFDRLIGIENLSSFHFNDSKKEMGSKVDRHANLGQGLIPLEGLQAVARYAESKSIPIILETPDKNPGDRINDLKVVRGWFS